MSRAYEDEDNFRDTSSGAKTTLIVVGIVAGVILLIVLACAGIVYLGIRAISQTMSSAMQMVTA